MWEHPFKYRLFDMNGERCLGSGKVDRIGDPPSRLIHQVEGKQAYQETISIPGQAEAIKRVLELLVAENTCCLQALTEIDAIGFQAVHAGEFFGFGC